MRALAIAALLVVAARPATAEEAPDTNPARVDDAKAARAAGLPEPEENVQARERERREEAERRSDPFGLVLDGGVPEGVSLSLAFRPLPTVRFWVGPTWNYIAWGLQGGATAVLSRSVFTPLVSAEGGYYFGSDVSFLARNSQGVPEELKPLLSDMGSWYAAAHVGIEAGNPRGFSLSLRAGLAYMVLSSNGSTTFTTTQNASDVIVTLSKPRVRGVVPSVKLGFQYWF